MKLGQKISRYTLINNLRGCKNDKLYYSLYDDYEILDIYPTSEKKYMLEILFIHVINSRYYHEVAVLEVESLYLPIVHSNIKHLGEIRTLDFDLAPHNEVYVFNTLSELYLKAIYQYNVGTLATKIKEMMNRWKTNEKR